MQGFFLDFHGFRVLRVSSLGGKRGLDQKHLDFGEGEPLPGLEFGVLRLRVSYRLHELREPL